MQMQVDLVERCVESQLFTFTADRVALGGRRGAHDDELDRQSYTVVCIVCAGLTYRVVVIPQTLGEVTIHIVHSRIQHWCHQ